MSMRNGVITKIEDSIRFLNDYEKSVRQVHYGNLDLLKRAGFVDIMTVFKYICFEGFLAIK